MTNSQCTHNPKHCLTSSLLGLFQIVHASFKFPFFVLNYHETTKKHRPLNLSSKDKLSIPDISQVNLASITYNILTSFLK